VSSPVPKHRAQKGDASKAPKRAAVRLKRRWPRRILMTVNLLVVLCLVAVVAAYGYFRYELDSIKTDPFTGGTPIGCLHVGCTGDEGGGGGGGGSSSDGLKPENILLIGNETRQGLTPQEQVQFGSSLTYSGTLADIMMVLHLDPATGAASLLSIPRDLFAPMPAGSPVGSYQKMDAALNDGADGPNNLVEAIQQDLGIPINHFVELNFNGFINSVNALGGIYVYFPEPVYDAESLLYIPTAGCHHLNGFYALTLVRARHLQYDPPGDTAPRYDWPYDPESDLARIVRTHTFMKIVAQRAEREGKANPLVAVSFISSVLKQMTIDPALKGELLRLVEHYRDIIPANVPETTLSTTDVTDYYYGGYGIGDVLFPVEPVDNNVIAKWDPQALPLPVKPASVSVVSITGSSDAAASAGQALSSEGLKVTSETAGSVPASTTETLVVYHQGDVGEALYVMKYLSGSVMMEQSSSVAPGTIEVDLGSTVSVHAKVTTTTTAAGSTTTTAGATTTTAAPTRAAATPTTRPGVTTTTVPTPGGLAPSSSADRQEPWDPRACPS
jgi:LCP family protein required for cell wall assembly